MGMYKLIYIKYYLDNIEFSLVELSILLASTPTNSLLLQFGTITIILFMQLPPNAFSLLLELIFFLCLFFPYYIYIIILTLFKLYIIRILMEARITNTKVDIAFSNSLKKVKKNWILQIVLHSIQCIAMITMIPLDIYVFENKNQEVFSFFITASCVTFLNLFSKLCHLLCQLCDKSNCIAIATDLNHVLEEQAQSFRLGEKDDSNQFVSSKVYNIQTNAMNEQVNDQMRQSLQPSLSNMIKTLALSKDQVTRCTISIGSGISFALFIYGIVIMSTVPMKGGQIAVMVLFLLSQFLIQIQVFLCLIFIALVPLLCILVCFFVCCCGKGQKKANLPQSTPATIQAIQRSEGSPCSICFQNILLNEQIIVLPCSDKHIFHDKCITAWTAVKPNCPICRHDLSQ